MQTLTYVGTTASGNQSTSAATLTLSVSGTTAAPAQKKSVTHGLPNSSNAVSLLPRHCLALSGPPPPKPDTPWRRTDKRGNVTHEPAMWPHGMSNRMGSSRPVAYLMKYASKIESKNVGTFPHGARIHGAGGLDQSGRCIRRWVLWPAYVQGNAAVSDRFKPAPGGGFINHETGELLLSEFAPIGAGFSRFIRIRTTPRRIDPSGPFSAALQFPKFGGCRPPLGTSINWPQGNRK